MYSVASGERGAGNGERGSLSKAQTSCSFLHIYSVSYGSEVHMPLPNPHVSRSLFPVPRAERAI
jgi:hypothetical protein